LLTRLRDQIIDKVRFEEHPRAADLSTEQFAGVGEFKHRLARDPEKLGCLD